MKKLLGLTVAALGILALAGKSQAQIISLQYETNGSPSLSNSTSAGITAYNVADWNVQNLAYVSGTGATTSTLMTSTGGSSTISATVSSLGAYDSSNGNSFPAGGNHTLLSAYALTNYGSFNNTPLTLTLNGLSATDTYTLVAYVFDNDGTKASLTVGSSSVYFQGATNPLSSFTQITQTSSSGTGTNGDYALFSGLTGSASQTLTLSPLGGSLLGLSGFQLIDTSTTTTPEPSTYVLTGIGLLCLIVLRRRALRV